MTTSFSKAEIFLISFFVFSLPFHFGLFDIPGMERCLSKFATFSLIIYWIYLVIQKKIKLHFDIIFVLLAIYVLASYVSSFLSPVIPDSLIKNLFFKLLNATKGLYILIFVILFSSYLTKEKYKYIYKYHIYIGSILILLQFVFLLLHIFGIWPYNFAFFSSAKNNFARFQGFSQEPLFFASYFLLVAPCYILELCVRSKTVLSRKQNLFMIIISLITLYFTFCFTAYISFIIICSVIFLLYFKSSFRLFLKLLPIISVIVITLYFIPTIRKNTREIFIQRFYSLNSKSITNIASLQVRIDYWNNALRQFRAYPLLGVGPGSYGYFFKDYNKDLYPAEVFPQTPQNLFIGHLANTGLLGFIPFLAIFVIILYTFLAWFLKYWMFKQDKDQSLNPIIIWIILALGHFVAHMSYWGPWNPSFWFFTIIAYCGMKDELKGATP